MTNDSMINDSKANDQLQRSELIKTPKQMNNQTTSTVLMIRPVNFGFNDQTADSNAFQNRDADQQRVQQQALKEFNQLAELLMANGVDVIIADDTQEPHTPDSIFPNNWVSFHANGSVFLYPMQAENRRLERREDIITGLEDKFKIKHVIDLSRFEADNKFLEGTGSMVLDRDHKLAYACISSRTDAEVMQIFCDQTCYQPLLFHAVDQSGQAIYHTNVLMCVGTNFVVICLDSILDADEKANVIKSIKETGKELITISFEQMNHFAGNMLELKNKHGESQLVMSKNAYQSLTHEQRTKLEKYCKLLYSDISTIESNGGGSARCMITEVHLPF